MKLLKELNHFVLNLSEEEISALQAAINLADLDVAPVETASILEEFLKLEPQNAETVQLEDTTVGINADLSGPYSDRMPMNARVLAEQLLEHPNAAVYVTIKLDGGDSVTVDVLDVDKGWLSSDVLSLTAGTEVISG